MVLKKRLIRDLPGIVGPGLETGSRSGAPWDSVQSGTMAGTTPGHPSRDGIDRC